LIDRPPQIVAFAVDTEKDFIEVPLISRLRPLALELIGILLPKRAAPLADGFVGHHDSSGTEQLIAPESVNPLAPFPTWTTFPSSEYHPPGNHEAPTVGIAVRDQFSD
jgi:hypothetical protein